MPLLINQKIVENDSWQLVDIEALEQLQDLSDADIQGDIIVPLAFYLEHRDQLLSRSGRLGLQVNGDDDLAALYAEQANVALIAVEFPTFRDGRGFSIARQLVRIGFAGEIRAVGDVARDRLAHMQSCGFNAFLIPEDRFSEEDLSAFAEVSVNYQGTVADPRPIFRR
ncbi:DUF934 domain-containing protein [Neptunomonas qingdaonensis]|uniref:Uncharacterized conserved protein, DUF934 family n=1 Tax=Neptunomonas qingdaonensis TaxID=1045558 RepID=A0A1I2TJW7_9GAMM|nr:DUF934 domain-containing protein [Neptunomonas qingdaonensis]SFG65212.1 Uncharacterized conserved protein, DUF934 family [Neptunomonas qingdaonensis]